MTDAELEKFIHHTMNPWLEQISTTIGRHAKTLERLERWCDTHTLEVGEFKSQLQEISEKAAIDKLKKREKFLTKQIVSLEAEITEFKDILNKICNVDKFKQIDNTFRLYDHIITAIKEWKEGDNYD